MPLMTMSPNIFEIGQLIGLPTSLGITQVMVVDPQPQLTTALSGFLWKPQQSCSELSFTAHTGVQGFEP